MRHCSMVAIPTIEEEDARRPNRERQNLVTEQTRIINQIKAIFTRFGIRTLRPTMRKLAEGLEDLRTAEGTPLPQNTLSELRRHLARLRFVRDQIRTVEQERLRKLAVAPKSPDAMVRLIARCPWRWCRNGGHAGQRDVLAPLARSQSRGSLRRPDWLAR
jgi:transposase